MKNNRNEIIIALLVEADGWDDEEALLKIVRSALDATQNRLSLFDIASELSVVFTDDERIRAMNAQWRNKDKATNVLSFPAFNIKIGDKIGPLLGDIIIARETVLREAREENKSFHDHLTHLIIHGLLHLMGYDHETQDEAEEMEQLEREILSSLAISDPYEVSLYN